jgi:DNA-binding FrmR family transcriptional regulator
MDISLGQSTTTEMADEEFAFSVEGSETTDYAPVIDVLKDPDTRDDAVEALIEAAETAIERERGRASAKAALKTLSQAHAKLTGIEVTSAGEATLPAMLRQIDAIRSVLDKVQAGIVLRQNEKTSVNAGAEE